MTAPNNMSAPAGYGGPAPQQGFPPPQGYPSAPEPQGSNGFAVASLIFGIIGGIPLALGFGIAGLVRAGKVNKGKVMSWIGIVLAILWLVPTVLIVKSAVGTASKVLDPGCVAAESAAGGLDSKLSADGTDAAAIKADITSVKQQMDAAAAKSKNADAKAAIQKFSQDLQELLQGMDAGTIAPDIEARMTADGNAVDKACGRH